MTDTERLIEEANGFYSASTEAMCLVANLAAALRAERERAEKAERERDAQHELVLKLTAERDEVALRYRTAAAGWEEKGRNLREDLDAAHAAAAAWEVQAQDFRDKLVAAEENNRKAICTYCGHVGQKEDVPAHIDECLKHPLSWKNDPQGYALEMLALRRQVAELRGS